MSARISAGTFYQYLSCPLQLWFEHHGDQKKKGAVSPIRKRLGEAGLAHERRIAEQIGFDREVVTEDEDEAFQETLRLMKEGRLVYQGVLIDGDWVGRPDFLVPKRGKSRLGSHHYTVKDVKLASELTDEHRFQLTFYALLLERIQGVRPRYVYMINGQGKEIRFEIAEFIERFELTLSEVERILAGEKPAPFLSGSCKESPWYAACLSEALACNDLSLVYKIWRGEYERLRAVGIKTVSDLAGADHLKLKEKTSGISANRLLRLQQQAISLVEGTHIVVGEPDLPKTSVEIYYDVETDVLQTPALHYLHGLLVVRRGKKSARAIYKQFLVRNPAQEGKVWLRFCRFINKLPQTAVIYHYGRYEHQVIAELTGRYGAPRSALERFEKMIDLSKVATRAVIFPTPFCSLKDLAKYLGFKWRHKEASGINSVAWYQEWRCRKNSKRGKKMQKDILEYNEDDVRATLVLKDFLAGLGPW
jgi:uncharacterized protein